MIATSSTSPLTFVVLVAATLAVFAVVVWMERPR